MSDIKNNEQFEDFFKRVEKNIGEMKSILTENFIPQTEKKLKEHVFVSVIISLGIGIIGGVILSLLGKRRGKK